METRKIESEGRAAYRDILTGEELQEGDEVWLGGDLWKSMIFPLNNTKALKSWTYRRPIKHNPVEDLENCPYCGSPDHAYHQCDETAPLSASIEALVCADIQERQKKGLAKYGVSVADNPLPFEGWIQHAYEEALDLAIYLRKMMEMQKTNQGDRRQ